MHSSLIAKSLLSDSGGRVRDVRLFGSYARGTQHAESDVDVLVIVEGLTHRDHHEVIDMAEDVFADTWVPISPLAMTPERFATLIDREHRAERL